MGVIIGMDPHKRSATIEVIDERGSVLAAGRYGTGKAGYAQMLTAGRRFGGRVWAIEGCNGAGRHIAHRGVVLGQLTCPALAAGYAGASRPATWRMSGEPTDSCTLRANSHCRTRWASTLARAAIRLANPAGSAASRSSQLSMCCSKS
jgi:hypothetical protein